MDYILFDQFACCICKLCRLYVICFLQEQEALKQEMKQTTDVWSDQAVKQFTASTDTEAMTETAEDTDAPKQITDIPQAVTDSAEGSKLMKQAVEMETMAENVSLLTIWKHICIVYSC